MWLYIGYYICNFNHNHYHLVSISVPKPLQKKLKLFPTNLSREISSTCPWFIGGFNLKMKITAPQPHSHRGATKGSRWTKIQWWNPSEVTSKGDDTANDMCLNVYIYICKIYIYLFVYKYIYIFIFRNDKCIHILSKCICM